VQEALDWVVESNNNLVFLLLDFEKTFDRIEWDFFFPALSKLSFSPEWVKWVSTLYWHSISKIKINGEIEEAFSIHR